MGWRRNTTKHLGWLSLVCGNGGEWVEASHDLGNKQKEVVVVKFKVPSKLRENTK